MKIMMIDMAYFSISSNVTPGTILLLLWLQNLSELNKQKKDKINETLLRGRSLDFWALWERLLGIWEKSLDQISVKNVRPIHMYMVTYLLYSPAKSDFDGCGQTGCEQVSREVWVHW